MNRLNHIRNLLISINHKTEETMEMNFDYLFKEPIKMTITEFINYAKENPKKFICYCEIILDILGNVYMVSPSHKKTLMWLYCKKYNITNEELYKEIDVTMLFDEYIISKEKYVAVWYDYIKISCEGMTSRQKRTIRLLQENGLIHKNINIHYCDEYQKYLRRKEHGYE